MQLKRSSLGSSNSPSAAETAADCHGMGYSGIYGGNSPSHPSTPIDGNPGHSPRCSSTPGPCTPRLHGGSPYHSPPNAAAGAASQRYVVRSSLPPPVPHSLPAAAAPDVEPSPRKCNSAPALKSPKSATASPRTLSPPTDKADKRKISFKAMVRRVMERKGSQDPGDQPASPLKCPLAVPPGPGGPAPEQTGYRDVGYTAGHTGGQALHCSEPSYQVVHVRVLEALLASDGQDPEGIYVNVELGDAKQTTTVKPGTWSPKWREDLLLGCLHPGTVEAGAGKALLPPTLEVLCVPPPPPPPRHPLHPTPPCTHASPTTPVRAAKA